MAPIDETQQQAEGLSKSAKRRAAKKARDSAAAEAAAPEPAPAPPAPEPKAKAKGKAKAKAEPAAAAPPAPEPKAEPKAKAKGKAKAKAEPEPPAPVAAAAPKAKAKAKAQAATPEPKAANAATAAAPKAAPKQAAKAAAQKGKAPAKVEEEEPEPKESTELAPNWVIDDGSGPSWEVNSGMSKKQQKRKEREAEQKAMAKAAPGGKAVPGMGPVNTIPGMAPAGAQAGAKGVSQSVAADVDRILAMKTAVAEEKAPEGNSSSATVHVPENRIGIVIGPKGSKIKLIQEKTGVSSIDTTGQVFTIVGPPQAVAKAEAAIKELVEKGYCALAYDDFAENFVNVHPSCFPDLIGKNGAVVRKIKEELGVEINFPETQKNAPAAKKYKVTLAGKSQDVEKARAVINNIMMYSHDELTHPGLVHEELEIEAWAWRYIIGTGGSEMKHIQNNFKVKVNIPREHSLNQQVLVVGENDAVYRAKAYIERLVWNAEHKTTGRDKVDNGDIWGDEEEEEPWMKQYMYKR